MNVVFVCITVFWFVYTSIAFRKPIVRWFKILVRWSMGKMSKISLPQLQVSGIEFNDGSKLDISGDDLIVLVGPNNSGKSATLKELLGYFQEGETPSRKILRKITIESPETYVEIRKWLSSILKRDEQGYDAAPYIGAVYLHRLKDEWESRHQKGFGSVAKALVIYLTTEERLRAASPVESIDFAVDVEKHPLHRMFIDEEFSKQIDDKFYVAFSEHLNVNRGAGPTVRLHVGSLSERCRSQGWSDYLSEINSMPMLHHQGDGMRSFVGVLISVMAGGSRIILLDEPEAFLHPPQASALGAMLTENLPEGRQLFVATHSSDFLKGVLDSKAKVRLVRIKRDGNANIIHELDPIKVKSLWSDPLMRYSKVLEGLFHDGVIVCEGDTDCRFYSAIIDSITEKRPHLDLIFLHGGGKARVHSLVGALRTLGVPVKAVVDFDALADEPILKRMVEAFGACWEDFRGDWKTVTEAIGRVRAGKSIDNIKDEVDEIFRKVTGHNLPEQSIEELKKAIRQGSGWLEAKRIGKAYITAAAVLEAYDRMDKALRNVGLFIVPVGEVEGFYRKNPGKGPRWTIQTLELDLKNEPDLVQARTFCNELLRDWLGSPISPGLTVTPAASP